jgi:PAS domain S-box-containing protein
MATWDLDLATRKGRWSGTRFALFGLPRPPGDVAGVEEWFDRIHPDDIDMVREAVERCFELGEPFHAEYRIRRADTGEERWLQSHGNRIAPGSGRGWRAVGVSVDITQRKQWERRQQLLVNELNHRVKNTLAIIQSIAHQSFRPGVDPAAARADFESRLAALSAAHDLLTRTNWEAASLRQVVTDALAAAASQPERISTRGPDLALAPKTAVSLAMALHELSTNALKYGALSNDSGTVTVGWSTAGGRLRLEWREAGGPPVTRPTRRGFGSRMIERGLAAELAGTVTIDYAPAGLVCTVDAPLPDGAAA